MAIRILLLEGDVNKCNSLLVAKYPSTVDVKYVIAKALHLQDPLQHQQPTRNPFKFSLPYLQEMSRTKKVSESNGSSSTNGVTDKKQTPKKTKIRFPISLDNVALGKRPTENQKMIDLRGSQGPAEVSVPEDQFEFLEDETPLAVSKVSLPELRHRVAVWQAQLGRSLDKLEQSLAEQFQESSSSREIKSAVMQMRMVRQSMAACLDPSELSPLKEVPSLPSLAMDALELSSPSHKNGLSEKN